MSEQRTIEQKLYTPWGIPYYGPVEQTGDALREALKKVTEDEVIELKAERDRLKATVEELRTVSAGLRAALERIQQKIATDPNTLRCITAVSNIAFDALAGGADRCLYISVV